MECGKTIPTKKTVKKISEFYQVSEDFIYQNKVPSIKEIQNKDKTSVLLDSNILLDVFLKRTPFFKDSYDVFNLCLSKKNSRNHRCTFHYKFMVHFKKRFNSPRTTRNYKHSYRMFWNSRNKQNNNSKCNQQKQLCLIFCNLPRTFCNLPICILYFQTSETRIKSYLIKKIKLTWIE